MQGAGLAQLHESTHDIDAHFDSLGSGQHIGRLDGTMLGEGDRQSLGELQLLEVVAICDHLGLLRGGELQQCSVRAQSPRTGRLSADGRPGKWPTGRSVWGLTDRYLVDTGRSTAVGRCLVDRGRDAGVMRSQSAVPLNRSDSW